MTTTVRTITEAEHLAFLASRPSASYLQTPAWARAKPEWTSESLGWFDGDQLVGAGLVLYRQLPKVRRYLAYLPEGPVLDWDTDDLGALLRPMARHLKRRGAFGVRIGPPVVWRTWHAATIKAAVADEDVRSLTEVKPDVVDPVGTRTHNQLRSLGWLPPEPEGEGFAAGQPTFRFWVRLTGQTPESLLKGMNQLWRRNIKKADKAGVTVRVGDVSDLPAFHRVYAETAVRDGFTPRPLSYFETMFAALQPEAEDRIRLYLAEHEGDLVAATIWTRVGGHVWYAYGASTSEKRDVRGSNAIQWRMMTDALEAGADVYDLRGITDSVAGDDPHLGLIQFKVGTGGEAYENLGEWDLPLNRLLYTAFDLYLRRRG
ncbi:peptidoglycan bridge formation glycyltransferase FemA/FemB family protein [Desertihabitans brevis]|uniref:Peptidoglycan bridge formation glycyltransferase FemA/FemB family protein n=1 Tax=Desertihabitans brevis TaxID=2268447 RepID=A0A367YS79_9ACTN|nr:peptidoglycan bridge formation glycyltransferase FemA/FemB family protein [Desertihabitans brevis]RCK68745.1 peptidoglycan bridge formation glycyltransferase FemA/FemB family protein [Desertihabitans brevis]